MAVEGAVLLAAGLASALLLGPLRAGDWRDLATAAAQALALATAGVLAFHYNDLYDFRIVRGFAGFAARLVQAFGLVFVLLAGLYALFPETQLAGGPFASSLVAVVAILVPLRAAAYVFMRSRRFADRVLLVGSGPLAERILAETEAQPAAHWDVVGIVEDGPAPPRLAGRYPLLGPLDRLGKLIEEARPHRIVVALGERRGRLPVADLVEARLRSVAVEDGAEAYERLTGKLPIEALRPSTLAFARDVGRYQLDLAVARATSWLAAVAGLALAWPVLALVALAIRLDSPGPVLFRQARAGLRGRPFELLKFRTMRPADGPASEWARDNEARITRVGRWLRRYRLDELPQLWNVLRGDLNLVGPRPHPVSNQALFTAAIPYYALRSLVRPGLTGWAQIRYGYANTLDEETEKMRYDLYYIKHLSPWLDLRILVDTVKLVLFGRGARAADAYAGATASIGATTAQRSR
jgi:exopolysaccharide biosynthesis polyprenyl glycosylphosphotransferase